MPPSAALTAARRSGTLRGMEARRELGPAPGPAPGPDADPAAAPLDLSGPAAAVLGLQRLAGNSATAGWLARQGAATAARPRRTVVERFATAGRETGPVWNVVMTVTGVPEGDTDGYADFYSSAADGIQQAAASIGGEEHSEGGAIRFSIRYRAHDLGEVTTEAFEKARASVLGPTVVMDLSDEPGLVTDVETAPAPSSTETATTESPPPAPSESAADLIDKHTHGLNLREEELAEDLRNRMPGQSDLVVGVLRTLPSTDRDDVAYALIAEAADDQIAAWGKDGGGRRVLVLVMGELSSGTTGDEERAQQERVMRLMGEADVPAEEAPPAEDLSGDKPADLIAKHTSWGNLRERELATDLLALLIAGRSAFAGRVMDALENADRDDVATHLLEVADDDAKLQAIARDPGGRAFLLRLVREMFGGVTTDDEREQMQRVMRLVTSADREVADAAGADQAPAQTVEVEVITFLYGSAALDAIGTVLAGARGHTAITIGDLAYSFELGWSGGRTRAEYLGANRHRDAVGQVLALSVDDVRTIQDKLNKSIGKGFYAVGGDICTDSSAQALEGVLTTLGPDSWDPGSFVGMLDATGKVKAHRFYPKAE